MHGLRANAEALATDVGQRAVAAGDRVRCDIVLCPPHPMLRTVWDAIAGSPVLLGGQDCHPMPEGAFTGDVAAEMLADAGCRYVIVGHSERRHAHREDDAAVRAKAAAAHRADLKAIVCVGETLEERDAGGAEDVVSAQLAGALPDAAGAANTVVAYEPVWAIGTGRVAELEDIAAMHAAIRARVPEGASMRLLYGGSVKPNNAEGILALDDVDGALVGGASLDAEDFFAIVEACP